MRHVSFKIEHRALRSLLTIALVVTFVLLGLTVFAHHAFYTGLIKDNGLLYLSGLFNLSNENTIGTWFSSMLFMTTGVLALVCFSAHGTLGKSDLFRHGWIVMAVVFILMSMDEIGSLHENAGKLNFFDKDGGGGWESVVAIPLLMVFIYMLLFAWSSLRKSISTLVLLIVGSILFLSIPLQEHFEMKMWSEANYVETWRRPIQFVLLEEGSELLAAISFLAAMVYYVSSIDRLRQVTIVSIALDSKTKIMFAVFAAAVLALPILFYLGRAYLNSDEGIVQNWFPSALSLLIAYVMAFGRVKPSRLALTSFVFISIYFGINFYQVMSWHDIRKVSLLIMPTLFFLVAAASVYIYRMGAGVVAKGATLLWAISVIVSMFVPHLAMSLVVLLSSLIFLMSYLFLITNKPMLYENEGIRAEIR